MVVSDTRECLLVRLDLLEVGAGRTGRWDAPWVAATAVGAGEGQKKLAEVEGLAGVAVVVVADVVVGEGEGEHEGAVA